MLDLSGSIRKPTGSKDESLIPGSHVLARRKPLELKARYGCILVATQTATVTATAGHVELVT